MESVAKILNVDDHEVNRYIRTQVLQSAGYEVIEAATGTESLELFERKQPQLVLLDVNLPDMSGFDVCRRIKSMSHGATAVVVHISATAIAARDQAEGLESGADGYLPEPVEPELLLAHVRSLLRLRSTEQRLRASEGRFRTVFSEAPIGMGVFASDRRLQQVNATLANLLGYDEQELMGVDFSLLSPPEDAAEQRTQIDKLFADGAGRFDKEIRYRTKRGETLFVKVKVSLISEKHLSAPQCAVALIEDITQRKQVEAALLKSNEELNQFAYAASHDLQEPLRTVAAYTQLLARKYKAQSDPETDKLVRFVIDAVDRMRSLVQDLLALSQVQGHVNVQREPVDTDSVFQRALSNIQSSIIESGAVVTSDGLPTVAADPAQLTQVFQNLLSNAIKYRGAQPLRIHASAQEREHEWMFSVRDNGAGFDQKYSELIFGVFKRLDPERASGTGIGLALCKKIIERHGGRIWAESQLGKGSCFHFTLPRFTDLPLAASASKSH